MVIAAEGGCKLVKVNAVTSNVADLRDALKMVRYHGAENCYLFVDEIHRFNKAQQDLLLPDVESGEARLIGATTHNPALLRHRSPPEQIPIICLGSFAHRGNRERIESSPRRQGKRAWKAFLQGGQESSRTGGLACRRRFAEGL